MVGAGYEKWSSAGADMGIVNPGKLDVLKSKLTEGGYPIVGGWVGGATFLCE